jgi:hypothetical protein
MVEQKDKSKFARGAKAINLLMCSIAEETYRTKRMLKLQKRKLPSEKLSQLLLWLSSSSQLLLWLSSPPSHFFHPVSFFCAMLNMN